VELMETHLTCYNKTNIDSRSLLLLEVELMETILSAYSMTSVLVLIIASIIGSGINGNTFYPKFLVLKN